MTGRFPLPDLRTLATRALQDPSAKRAYLTARETLESELDLMLASIRSGELDLAWAAERGGPAICLTRALDETGVRMTVLRGDAPLSHVDDVTSSELARRLAGCEELAIASDGTLVGSEGRGNASLSRLLERPSMTPCERRGTHAVEVASRGVR